MKANMLGEDESKLTQFSIFRAELGTLLRDTMTLINGDVEQVSHESLVFPKCVKLLVSEDFFQADNYDMIDALHNVLVDNIRRIEG